MRRRTCGSHEDMAVTLARVARTRELLTERSLTAEGTERLHVGIQYFVLYSTPDENLSLELLQSQHQMLNACYNQLNSGLTKVPSTGHYAFADRIGNSAIVFLPTDHRQLSEAHIKRVACTGAFSGVDQVFSYLQSVGVAVTPGYLNVALAPLDGILGEGAIAGNVCVIHSPTVGGALIPGSDAPYDLGMTLVHEVGHNFGLMHVFNDGCAQVHADIPRARNPNYTFNFQTGLCNRMRDCKIYVDGDHAYEYPPSSQAPTLPYSCMDCPSCTVDCQGLYEMGCNIMDYPVDSEMVMFSKEQAIAMRTVLLTGENSLILLTSDGGELQTVGTVLQPNASNGTAAKSGTLWTPLVIGVVSGVGAAVLLAALLVAWLLLRRRARS